MSRRGSDRGMKFLLAAIVEEDEKKNMKRVININSRAMKNLSAFLD